MKQSQPFGVVLRRAIKAEYGSQREFARALGVTEGRVSQLVGGSALTEAATLRRLLPLFGSAGWQTALHEAWVAEFLPTESAEALDGEAACRRGLELWSHNRPRQGLLILEEARRRENRPAVWLELSTTAMMVNMRIGRSGLALAMSREIAHKAKQVGETGSLLTCLWLRSLALRNVESAPLDLVSRAYQQAADLAFTHQPRSADRGIWQGKRLQLLRDFGLQVLTANLRKPVAGEHFDEASRRVQRSLNGWEDPLERAMTLEVRARLEVTQRQLVKAEETLYEIRSMRTQAELAEKTGLTRAAILIARGEIDEAIARIAAIADQCLAKTNLHHFRVADRMLAGLVAPL